MRIVLFAVSAALMMTASAQDAKVAAPPQAIAKETPPPAERALTETEVLKLQNTLLQIDRIGKEFKIDQYNEKLKAPVAEQNTIFMAACKSIGLTDEQIKNQECSLATGVDLDGHPVTDAQNKPVSPRVWWIKPAPKPAN